MEGYHAATWRAWSCAHVLLHLPRLSFETEGSKQALAIAFCKAQSKPVALRKPLLLVIASRCICCPDYIKKVLEKDEDEGLTVWVRGVVYIFAHLFQPGLSSSSKIKMAAPNENFLWSAQRKHKFHLVK
ncbi:hypothetical protein AMTRI_Chr02g253800 [Amborella trichopoda]